MTQVLIETTERKKAQKNFEEHVAVHYEGRNLKKEAVKKRIQQRSKHVKGKVAPKVLPKPKQNIKAINNRGFIIAPNGIRLHGTPSPSDKAYTEKKGVAAQICKPSNKGIQVLYEDMDNKGWYKIRTPDKKEGFVEKHYIAIVPYNKYLDAYTYTYHFVLPNENFETHIAKRYLNNIALKTGFDRRNLAEAFSMLNAQSKHDHGVHFDGKTLSPADLLSMAAKLHVDPSFHKARVNYKTMQLKQYHIVRVPNYRYILLQKQLGTLSSRPEFMNKAVDVGHALAEVLAGVAGLIAGVVEGLIRGIYDMLEGVIDQIKQIITTIQDLFSGKLFTQLKQMYQAVLKTIKELSVDKLKDLLLGVLGSAAESVKKTILNWAKSSSFEKGKVIGLVLGNILLEVLIGIFTGGSANLAKWASKLGKLGKVLLKITDFAHEIKSKLKAKLPKLFQKGPYENDKDDSKNWMRAALFAQGKITTERFDAKGYTADYLLNVLDKSNIYPKLKPKWGKKHITGNIYAITLTASPTKVLDAHFMSGEKEKEKEQQTNSRLPRNNGKWEGKPGNGKWFSELKDVLEVTKGEPIEFKNGFPKFAKWAQASFKFKSLNGTHEDFDKVYERIKIIKGLNSKSEAKKYLKMKGLTPHHHEDGLTIELIPTKLHSEIPHIGGASILRNKA